MQRTWPVVAGGIAVGAVLALVLTGYVGGADLDGGVPALTSGRGVTVQVPEAPVDAPELDLVDVEGRGVSTDSLRGKVVLLNFWATWCGPCREEIPLLVALQAHYGDQLAVVGLSIDDLPPEDVREFAREFQVNYPIAMSTPAIEAGFGGVYAVPSTVVLDPQGRIALHHLGLLRPQQTEHEVRALAGLPTDAAVVKVREGEGATSEAVGAGEMPGVDLAALGPAERTAALERLHTEYCDCGCGMTLAECRVSDPSCDVSLSLARQVVREVTASSR
jgi:thiol-disulfide isomerase/thioredoxin